MFSEQKIAYVRLREAHPHGLVAQKAKRFGLQVPYFYPNVENARPL